MLSNLLLYRFAILNGLAGALVIGLWWTGYLVPVFAADESRLTFAIAGLFAVGWIWVAKQIVRASAALNSSKIYGPLPGSKAGRDKEFAKIEWLGSVSEWLVALGLLGTVIGFSIALSGIDQAAVARADGAQSAVGTLMQGMRVALNTTLLGAALALWHEVNVRMLKTALAVHWADRITAWQSARADAIPVPRPAAHEDAAARPVDPRRRVLEPHGLTNGSTRRAS